MDVRPPSSSPFLLLRLHGFSYSLLQSFFSWCSVLTLFFAFRRRAVVFFFPLQALALRLYYIYSGGRLILS